MERADLGDRYVIKFRSGEDLLRSLEEELKGTGCSWCVVMGIGMLEDAVIGYFDGESYSKKQLEVPHELVALHGTITTKDGFTPHLHCGLVGPDHILVGGHLFSARVKVVCEMVLLRLDVPMIRKEDPVTGLRLLTIG